MSSDFVSIAVVPYQVKLQIVNAICCLMICVESLNLYSVLFPERLSVTEGQS